MVNVAGRSKGCSTCRKRRIKCDETQPICLRCQKLGVPCDGPKTLVFVQGKIVKSRRTQRSSSNETVDEEVKALRKRQDAEAPRSISPGSESSVQDVPLRFNENEVYVCYLRRHLFPNGPVDLELQKLQVSDLDLARNSTSVGDSPLFTRAALAFATLFFGSRHSQTPILVEGYKMHSAALQHLNQALSIPGCHTRDDILNVVSIMAMVELYLPSGPRNWLKHMLGLERLLGLRDPGSLIYASPQLLEMYKGLRHMVLIAALRNRSPSIFARPRWKAVLQTALSLETTEERELHDVLADCSVLNAVSDELTRTWNVYDPMCSERVETVRNKGFELLAFVQSWKERWDRDKGNAHVAEDDLEAMVTGAPLVFQTVYRFRDDSVARMFMLYSTALIYVLQVIEAAENLQPTLPLAMEQGTPAGIPMSINAASIYAAAVDIFRSIPHYLKHRLLQGKTDFASPVVQWAAFTCWQVFDGNNSAEGRWVMQTLSVHNDYRIAKAAWEL
ncbi:hypothetical protein yc1106_00907 [Curvularia clavata]|uniref:Zn(2)-C6 fungal-type domain-containing protein n=1 Tax=Curvularia clavata TaxID=95742 RepID=A0A9Q8Z3E5_CURCL|nr:hypothetical protein yc1106_00907 [Curvularia clavata]